MRIWSMLKLILQDGVLRISVPKLAEEKERQPKVINIAEESSSSAHLEDGVLRISMPKLAEEKERQPKVINIAEESSSSGEDIKATKAAM
ncbi:hypothetical protein Patl1_36662 [Pistacia atlantica]|nr:hypothetical protein Patl1_36662 [Pistacia atlantica]